MTSFGIMGGTFDPIHFGHLLLAERAREAYGLQTVVFVPAGYPWQKPYRVTDPDKRWAMTTLAIQGNPGFEASRIEIDRPGPSYSFDTIHQMVAERPGQTPYFITGMDAILQILTWRRSDELPQLTHFVAAARRGYGIRKAKEALSPEFLERTQFLKMPLMEISSTAIRNRVCNGHSIRYLTPERVRQFILKEGLYKD